MLAWQDHERDQLLADVAEMYYEEGKTQQDISAAVGITRSTVSRMLTEAQQKGIVEIHIHRPLHYDRNLEDRLVEEFSLDQARVLVWHNEDYDRLQRYLGIVGAHMLSDQLAPGKVIGLTWGTTLKAIVDAMEGHPAVGAKVVQLAGALGARGQAYDAIALVQRLAQYVGGDPVYLNAPFLVDNAEMARALIDNPSNNNTIEIGKHCDIVLVGVGKVDPQFSTLYLGGHITLEELYALQAAGAIGDACGHPFDEDGNPVAETFDRRLVGISRDDLRAIPIRLGVAGGPAKVLPLRAALRAGLINHLVTDSLAARRILGLPEPPAPAEVEPAPDSAVAETE